MVFGSNQKGMRLRPPINALCGLAFLALTPSLSLVVNGKSSESAPIRQGDEVYIPLSALKAAGAEVIVKEGVLHVRFLPVTGGSNQITAVEGAANEWLFNGIWRVRILKTEPTVDPFDENKPGVAVTLEARNGTQKSISLFTTGAGNPELIDEGGVSLKVDEGAWQVKMLNKTLLPGEGVTATIAFYYPHGTAASATKAPGKLIVPIDTQNGLLRDTGLKYSVKAPSFRVSFKSDAGK